MLFLLGQIAAANALELPSSIVTAPKEKSPHLANHYSSEVVASEQLERFDHLDQLHLQGFSTAGGTARGRYFQIRGIGERSAYEAIPNESVSLILDNIDYSGVGGVFDLLGMESLELYKGPQNTLMGPSALAGMLVGTTKSAKTNSTTLTTEVKNYDGLGVGLEKGNVFENGSSYFSLGYKKEDGYFNNTALKREDTNQIDELSFKGKFNFKPFSATFHYFDFNDGYDIFNFNNSKTTISDKPGEDNQRTLGLALTHTQNWNSLALETILSGHLTKTLYSYDEDWGNNDFWRELPGWNADYNYNIEFYHDIKTLSLEERLTYELGNFFHRSGLYFKHYEDDSQEKAFADNKISKDLQGRFRRQRYSLYHESEYRLSPIQRLFAGARLEQVDSDYKDNLGQEASPQELLWGARIGTRLTYHNNHDFTLSLARGYKPGGVNIGSNITRDRRNYQEESLYELAAKFTGDFKQLSYSAEFFYAYREDIQVETSYQDDPSDPSSFTFYTDNATTGKSFGAETKISWENLSFWQSEAKLSLLKSEYGSYTYGERNLKGRSFAYAPEYSWGISNSFNLSRSLTFTLEHDYQASFYFGNSHDERAPSRLLTSAQLAYATGGWKATLWGRNIFSERSETRGFFFGNRPPNFEDERFVQVGAPATYGLKVQKSF